MSKVYIRSQDREQLVLFGEGLSSIHYMYKPEIPLGENAKIAERHAVVAAGNNAVNRLGIYESKERCLEILDEIQNECESYYKSISSLNIPDMLFDMPSVYQMPET